MSHRALRVLLTTATLVVVTLTSLVYVSAQTTDDVTIIGRLNIDPNDIESVTIKDGVVTITKTNGEVITDDHSAKRSTKYYTPSSQWPYIYNENVASLEVNEAGDAVVLTYKTGRKTLYKLDGITPDEIEKVSIVSNLVAITKKSGEIWSYVDNKWQPRAPNVTVDRSQYCVARGGRGKELYVVRFKDHTKVYLRADVTWNAHWFVLSKDMALIDPATKDRYMIHSAKGGFPLGVVAFVKNEKGEQIYFEMIFPPLDKSINKVTFSEKVDHSVTIGYRAALDDRGWQFKDVKVQNDLPYFASEEYQAEINRKPREIRLESYKER